MADAWSQVATGFGAPHEKMVLGVKEFFLLGLLVLSPPQNLIQILMRNTQFLRLDSQRQILVLILDFFEGLADDFFG